MIKGDNITNGRNFTKSILSMLELLSYVNNCSLTVEMTLEVAKLLWYNFSVIALIQSSNGRKNR